MNNDFDKLKQLIEEDYKDWYELKLLNVLKEGNKTLVDIMDATGYKYRVDFSVVRNSRRRNLKLQIFFRNNMYTCDNILNFLKLNNKDFRLISNDLTNAKDDLEWICDKHGAFSMSWNCVKNGQGCPECGRIKASISRRNSYDYIKQEFEKRDLILISETYNNNEEKLAYICKKHLNEGVQYISYGNLISNKSCYYCGRERVIVSQTKPHNQFETEFHQVHGDKYEILGNYNGASRKIKIECKLCNNIWESKASHLLAGHGCPGCRKSTGENNIALFLDCNNFNYTSQFRFKDCKGKVKPLPFDFAVFDDIARTKLNFLIEFDGEHHYFPVNFGGCDNTVALKEFIHTQINDQIKTKYCQKNKIPLIRIPYWERDNVGNFLLSKLKEMKLLILQEVS